MHIVLRNFPFSSRCLVISLEKDLIHFKWCNFLKLSKKLYMDHMHLTFTHSFCLFTSSNLVFNSFPNEICLQSFSSVCSPVVHRYEHISIVQVLHQQTKTNIHVQPYMKHIYRYIHKKYKKTEASEYNVHGKIGTNEHTFITKRIKIRIELKETLIMN